jgi:predicted methyltransferase
LLAGLACLAVAVLGSVGKGDQSQPVAPVRPADRDQAVRAVAARVGVGEGSVVADLGAGRGIYTWPFAEVVGETGIVYAQEISASFVESLKNEQQKRDLPQVQPVLGREDDPGLPADSIDLIFLRQVYHHFGKPREMLQGIWRALKPGGYMVVVDRHRGTLRDYLPREERTRKHAWIAETTVVREAREEGFAFVTAAEEAWHEPEPFVLIFQRPHEAQRPGSDPDRLDPLPDTVDLARVFPDMPSYRQPAIIALGEARGLIRPIVERSNGRGIEIVLEEWATQRDEQAPLPEGVSLPATLTDQGDPQLSEPIDAVFFLDTYHLLFHGPALLGALHERLTPEGRVYILDRRAEESLSRRDASHRRQIAPKVVRREMAAAGFELCGEGQPPAPDRFVQVFRRIENDELTN